MSPELRNLPVWYAQWRRNLQSLGPTMSDSQLEASARLATVLLCGEQSAVRIFEKEIERQRPQATAEGLRQLRYIARDEHLHETALRAFCGYLPTADDQHRLKRRAQRFFAGLGRVESLAGHFGQIAQLDSAVCKIMWHLERAALRSTSPLRLLASRIKLDEARHVSVSRRYASALGLDVRTRAEESGQVRAGLVEMLQPVGSAFEQLGVDSDRLFADLRRQRRA
mgnify:FL=1